MDIILLVVLKQILCLPLGLYSIVWWDKYKEIGEIEFLISNCFRNLRFNKTKDFFEFSGRVISFSSLIIKFSILFISS